MNINATLFVQMIHFLFAYLILCHFLLRPVAELILRERAYKKGLETGIEDEERMTVHKQQQQKMQWHSLQKGWQNLIPSLWRYIKKDQPQLDIHKITLSSQELAQEADSVAKRIKERVDYVK